MLSNCSGSTGETSGNYRWSNGSGCFERSCCSPVLYADHIEARGLDLFEAACSQDLEGIVAKLASGRYEPEATTWVRSRTAATAKRMVGDFFDERAGTLAVADLTGG